MEAKTPKLFDANALRASVKITARRPAPLYQKRDKEKIKIKFDLN
jgi:hypothetical protein